jgi:hypothetical protein
MTISTVNNKPVPESSEEFVGVIRTTDIRWVGAVVLRITILTID